MEIKLRFSSVPDNDYYYKIIMYPDDQEIREVYFNNDRLEEDEIIDTFKELLYNCLNYIYDGRRFYYANGYTTLDLYWGISLSEKIIILEEKDVPELPLLPEGCIA